MYGVENMGDNERKQINEDRDANVNIDSVVVTSENGKRKPIDFIDYIETSSNENAIKIRALRQYISDKELLKIYQKEADGIEKESKVEERLEKIATQVALHINNIQNGIVVNLETLTIDEKASFEKAIKNNIYSEDSIVENLDKTVLDILNESKLFNDKSENEVVNYILENFKNDLMTFNDIDNDINDFLEKDETEMNLSQELKGIVKESKETIKKSPYETDIHLFEIAKLKILLKESEGTSTYNILLSQIEKFYEKHPEYVGKEIPVLDENGELNKAEVEKLYEYRESYEKMIILKHFDIANSMSKEELANLPENERNHIMLCAFAGLRYENNPNRKEQAISEEAKKVIKACYPDLDLSNEQALAEIFKQVMEFDSTLDSISLEAVIESCSLQVKERMEQYIIDDLESYVDKDVDLSKVNFDSRGRRFLKDPMKNYFVGSKIKFSEKDKEQYNEMYRDFTVDAWIDNKDDAINLRYKSLYAVLEDYKKAKSNPYIESKIKEIENNISEFEKKYGKMDIKENDEEFTEFRQKFVNAGLTKYLTRDTLDWQNGTDYKDLATEHKKGYMRNILVCLDYIKESDKIDEIEFSISKLALRRLELMNSKDKEFISFDENGGFKINKELLLKEYNELTTYTYSDFEELKYSAKLRKNEYLLTKLDEYTKLPETAFVKVDKDNPEEAIKKIDQVRAESNDNRINKKIKNKEMEKGLAEKKFELVEINVASPTKEDTVRKPKINDQANLDDSTNANSELKENPIEASQIDDSAINNLEEEKDNKNPNIIEKIKNAVSTMKNFISKHISGKEKVKLLESGETDKKEEEAKKAEEKSDFNALISADIPLQDQQDFSKKMQMKNSTAEEKSNSEQEERM